MENFKATLTGLNQLETAVLMQKYITILGMINYGSPEQKIEAKEELKNIESFIHQHVNCVAFETAASKLDFSEEEVEIINNVKF
jgi:hypothetical protein